jgi:hypothetical protein
MIDVEGDVTSNNHFWSGLCFEVNSSKYVGSDPSHIVTGLGLHAPRHKEPYKIQRYRHIWLEKKKLIVAWYVERYSEIHEAETYQVSRKANVLNPLIKDLGSLQYFINST